MRSEKEILLESKKFASEIRWKSWWHVATTFVVFAAALTVTLLDIWWPLRLVGSVVLGLVLVRMFVIYHDYQHHSILRGSRFAQVLAMTFGVMGVSPPSLWKRSHDQHHHQNSRLYAGSEGSFPLMTTKMFQESSFWQRVGYRLVRSPMVLALGWLTVFVYGMCLTPVLQDPKNHWDCVAALILHVTLIVVLAIFAPQILLFTLIIPILLSTALGSYLFYAQHNFPTVQLVDEDEWTYVFAALHSSSFCKMNPLMNWFTANIGFHHVHHLNSKIPFYRLPEAMRGIEELQNPKVTTLHPKDMAACLRLKLWDTSSRKLVGFDYKASA